mmetsp:Transcript_14449/g.24707  ORF Transcript_14449/g.24707 Transcript_14449/m.24707 type:complete len:230 (-) Transcript_14449:67-756(-)
MHGLVGRGRSIIARRLANAARQLVVVFVVVFVVVRVACTCVGIDPGHIARLLLHFGVNFARQHQFALVLVEIGDNLAHVELHGEITRRLAVVGLREAIDAVVEQSGDGVLGAVECRLVQRSVAKHVAQIRIGAARQQPRRVRKVATQRRLVQRCLVLGCARIELSAVCREQIQQIFGLVARRYADGVVQRRRSIYVADVGRMPFFQQQCRNLHMFLRASMMQRRPFIEI